MIFSGGAPQGGFSCPCGAIHLLYVGESTYQAAILLSEKPEGVFPTVSVAAGDIVSCGSFVQKQTVSLAGMQRISRLFRSTHTVVADRLVNTRSSAEILRLRWACI